MNERIYNRALTAFESLEVINRNEDARIEAYLEDIEPVLNAYQPMLEALKAVVGLKPMGDGHRNVSRELGAQIAAVIKAAEGK